MKIKVYCQVRYCLKYKIIDWKGGFIKNWRCKKHGRKNSSKI